MYGTKGVKTNNRFARRWPYQGECRAGDQAPGAGSRVLRSCSPSAWSRFNHTKLGKIAFHQLAPLQDFDLVAVDSGIDEAQLNELRECSVPVEVVPP